jgi:DNA-directed RNA polymerase specialized sigma24 family protein
VTALRDTGDAEAGTSFDALYLATNAHMIRLGWLLVGSRAVAEEVVHDAFLTVHQHWETIDNPGGYLRRAVVNGCVRWRRRRDHERRLLVVVGEPPPTGDPSIDTMWDAIGRLRPERRAVVVLRYWADLPHGEIAEILGCPVSTVRSRLHRALSDLRKETDR